VLSQALLDLEGRLSLPTGVPAGDMGRACLLLANLQVKACLPEPSSVSRPTSFSEGVSFGFDEHIACCFTLVACTVAHEYGRRCAGRVAQFNQL